MNGFNPAEHPRGPRGRFIPDTHAEPGDTTTLQGSDDAIQERRLGAARYVLDEYADLEIVDHSPAEQDFVRLEQLGDPAVALGNCGAAAAELIERAGAAEFDVEWLDEITINRSAAGGGQHVAILAGDRDGTFVIDYTARQFDPELPFPFVAGVEEWHAAVEKASGTGWVLAR